MNPNSYESNQRNRSGYYKTSRDRATSYRHRTWATLAAWAVVIAVIVNVVF